MPSSPVAFNKQLDDEVCVHLIGHCKSNLCCATPDGASLQVPGDSKTPFVVSCGNSYRTVLPSKAKLIKLIGVKCPSWSQVFTNVPFVIILVSLIEVVVYSQTDPSLRKSLNLHPAHFEEVYRFLTYMLLHVNEIHLLLNVLMQCILGTPLEKEQGHIRTALVYIGGGFGGALGSSMAEPSTVVEGASAAVYAILMAQISHIILNYWDLRFKLTRCLIVIILLVADIAHVVYHIYTSGNECPRISLSAHAFGALSGFLLGLATFHGTSRWTVTYQILAISVLSIVWLSATLMLVYRQRL